MSSLVNTELQTEPSSEGKRFDLFDEMNYDNVLLQVAVYVYILLRSNCFL